ncbi:ATP-binding cassette domain-containing protein, partial [Clostridioides difficile]|uniref:ATP-binding cassette domain-containing protein n=1 Tax=Clostridioides difficile TaxID=1496 RepID=UPI0011428A00
YPAGQNTIEIEVPLIRKMRVGVYSKIARGMQKLMDTLKIIPPPIFTGKSNIQLSDIEITAQKPLTINNLEVSYYFSFLPILTFSVDGGQNIVIPGFNGIGKSTLLTTLVKDIPRISGDVHSSAHVKLGSSEQDLKWENPDKTPLTLVAHTSLKFNQNSLRLHPAEWCLKAEQVAGSLSTC